MVSAWTPGVVDKLAVLTLMILSVIYGNVYAA